MRKTNKICILAIIAVFAIFMLSACNAGVDVTIYFDSNGGSEVAPIGTAGNTMISIPQNPTKEGYEFKGWFWDNETFEIPFTANSLADAPIQSNMTVFAKWGIEGQEKEPEKGPEEEPEKGPEEEPDNTLEYKLINGNTEYSVTKWLDTTVDSIVIPDSHNNKPVTSIGDDAFFECDKLKSITIPDSVTTIGSSAFLGCYKLKSITIPDSVTTIGNSAFSHCTGLTSITIPSSVTIIDNCAFAHCISLTSITIPNSVISIGGGAFSHCAALTSIVIPSSVTIINDVTFIACGLKSISILGNVTIINEDAFALCKKLESITIESITPPTLENSKDYDINESTKIYVPSASVDAYKNADGWSSYANNIFAIIS